MAHSEMYYGAALGSGEQQARYAALNQPMHAAPPTLAWWVRHPHLATVVVAIALVVIGMGLERLTQ